MSKDEVIGAIQWFNKVKGFGVVSTPDDEECFLHQSNAIDPVSSFSPGKPICFTKGTQKERLTAFEARLVKKSDLNRLLSLVDRNSSVKIQRTVKYRKRLKEYTKTKVEVYNVIELGLKFLFRNSTEDEIVEMSMVFLKNLENKESDIQKKNISLLEKLLPSKWEDGIRSGKQEESEYEAVWDTKSINEIVYEKLKKDGHQKLLILLWKYEFLLNHPSHPSDSLFDLSELLGTYSLPFDPRCLVEYHNLFEKREIELLKYYDIDDQILTDFFKNKFTKEPLKVEDIDQLHSFINDFHSVSSYCFDLISPNLNDRLIFDAWRDKKYAIYPKQKEIKEIKEYVLSLEDYKISNSLLFKFSDDLDYSTLSRIVVIYENSDEIIGDLLLQIFGKANNFSKEDAHQAIKLIKDTKIRNKVIEEYAKQYFEDSLSYLVTTASVDFIKECLSYLPKTETKLAEVSGNVIEILADPECKIPVQTRIDLLSLFGDNSIKKYYKRSIHDLSDDDKLQINKVLNEGEYSILTLDHWNFERSHLTVSLISTVKPDVTCSHSAFVSRLKEKVTEYRFREILNIYNATNLSFLGSLLVSKLSFADQYNLELCLESLKDDYNPIVEKFNREYSELEIEDFVSSIKTFMEFDVQVSVDFIQSRIANATIDELETVFKLSDELHNHFPEAIESGLLKLIKTKEEDLPLLKFIEHSYTPKLIEELLSLVDINKGEDVLIQLIIEKPVFKHLQSSAIKPVLEVLSVKYFKETIRFATVNYATLVNDILETVSFNEDNINDILTHIDENGVNRRDINEASEYSVVTKFFADPANENSAENMNQLFGESNYSYQLPILKYLTYKYHIKSITKDLLLEVLDRLDVVQLSSILYKAFITEEAGSREELMDKMNFLLKDHLKKLSENDITGETYNHVFSLSGLVKMCNGRKKYEGVDLWRTGDRSRYYTDGDHYVSTSYKENLYCEGRFWKEQKFFDSESNKPTGESCNMYWCRNDFCVGVNDEVDLSLNFQEWTLNELNELLELDLDRLVFTHIGGWLNRMDSIFEKLKCYSCKELLRPKNYVPKQLGFYAVPLFNCVNDECDKHGKVIRFTHCRGCGKILDSRECETCSKCNWLICDDDECGQCGCGANHISRIVQYEN